MCLEYQFNINVLTGYVHTGAQLQRLMFLCTCPESTYDELRIPLQLQDLRRVLLDHEQLLLPQHLLLGQELELGCVLQ